MMSDNSDREKTIAELELLLSCYQIASEEDRAAVWAALREYIPLVSDL